MSISEWRAGQLIDSFHQASPNIRGVFHRDIIAAIDSSRSLVTPYGRPRLFYERYGEELYKEAYAHIPQCTVADTTLASALECYEEINDSKEVFFISENHDSLLLQVPEKEVGVYAKLLKRCMTRVIDFSTYCSLKRNYKLTIPVDIEVSYTNFASFERLDLNAKKAWAV
jgi:DNA polymerase I-like protein with 3'-5' exonuclease and polymerase domains